MRRHPAPRGSRGYSLLELLAAVAIVLVVLGTALAFINHVHAVAQAGPEMADMQQRLRVAVDALVAACSRPAGGNPT